ncbi:MAG: hypothetical protein IJS58_04880 [Bacilli bacterium]|nr:hypothetical protein [Bacilli bacterium]
MMTKKNKNVLIALSIICIIAALFNVIYFVFPFDKANNAKAFWVSYSATMLLFVIGFISIFFAFAKKKLESKIFGIPIISFVYGVAIFQFIIDIIILITGNYIAIKSWIVWIIESIILAVLLIGIITRTVYRNAIDEMEKKDEGKTRFIDELRAEIKILCDNSYGKAYAKELQSLNENLKYTNPVSNKEVIELEDEMLNELDYLKKAIEEEKELDTINYINKLNNHIKERAARIKVI